MPRTSKTQDNEKPLSDEAIRAMKHETVLGRLPDATEPKKQKSAKAQPGYDPSQVGYKSPPKQTRFKPGQSGNPKGRPRKERTSMRKQSPGLSAMDEAYLRNAEKQVSIREGDEIRKVQAYDAAIQAQLKAAAEGNPKALKDFLDRVDEAQERRRLSIAEEHELWRCIKANQQDRIDAAQAKGEPTELILPHPDDIMIEDDKPVWFAGPVNEDEYARHLANRDFVELMFMQSELDEREFQKRLSEDPIAVAQDSSAEAISRHWDALTHPDGTKLRPEDHADYHATALFMAYSLNGLLPKRLQFSEHQVLDRLSKLGRMRQRDLLRALYRGWKSQGMPLKRGSISPPLHVMMPFMGCLFEFATALQDDEIDRELALRGEFCERAQEIQDKWYPEEE